MLSVPCTHQETKSPATPQPPFLPTVFSDLLPTGSKDGVYVALVRDRRKMSAKRFSLRCLGQGCPHPWRARAKGPVGSISPTSPHKKKSLWGRNQLQGESHSWGKRGEEEKRKLHPHSLFLMKRFNSNMIFIDFTVFLRYPDYRSLQVYHTPLLLCPAGNTQHDSTYKDRLKMRFIVAWNCSHILIT